MVGTSAHLESGETISSPRRWQFRERQDLLIQIKQIDCIMGAGTAARRENSLLLKSDSIDTAFPSLTSGRYRTLITLYFTAYTYIVLRVVNCYTASFVSVAPVPHTL